MLLDADGPKMCKGPGVQLIIIEEEKDVFREVLRFQSLPRQGLSIKERRQQTAAEKEEVVGRDDLESTPKKEGYELDRGPGFLFRKEGSTYDKSRYDEEEINTKVAEIEVSKMEDDDHDDREAPTDIEGLDSSWIFQ